MELPGLAVPKRFALGGIASHLFIDRRAQRGKDPRRWIPPPEGPGGRRWRGGDHATGDRRSRERPITRYVNRAVRPGARDPKRRPGGRAPARTKPGSHNVGLDDERRAFPQGLA